LDRYGDMRRPMSQVLLRLWSCLKPSDQLVFVNALVEPTLRLLMLTPAFLQEAGVALYCGLLEVEVAETGSLKILEALTLDTLDASAFDGILPPNFNAFFVSKLEPKLNAYKDVLAQKGKKFIVDITYLLELLADWCSLPSGISYEDERVDSIIKLMDYFKATGRASSYLKYVHMLESIHAVSGNFGEAGHSILLHANLLKFDDEEVDAVGIFPKELARQRKERLYKVAIDYFDKGKLWEEAIKLIKELRTEYEFRMYDYQKLADLLEMQATLVRKISSIERFYPDYFLVGYYGKGFEPRYQGKEMIFRGIELETRQEFLSRIQTRFPRACVLNYTDPPPTEVINSPQQHIQIFLVKPSLDLEEELNPSMPQNISTYYLRNNRKLFTYAKPFRKNQITSGNEFKSLWIRNYYYHTKHALPGILRRTEIIKTDMVEWSPILNAVNQLEVKNQEILTCIKRHEGYLEPPPTPVTTFTMILKGTIDAAVNGGINMYKEAFIVPEYEKNNPQDKPLITRLRESIVQQMMLLDKALSIHHRVIGSELGPLHESLEQQFAKLKINVFSF